MKDLQARLTLTYGTYIQGDLQTITKIAQLLTQVDRVSQKSFDGYSSYKYVIDKDKIVPEVLVGVDPCICETAFESLKAAYEHNAKKGNEYDD